MSVSKVQPVSQQFNAWVALADDDAAELDACAASIERQASELLTRVAQARDAARVLRSCSVTEKMVLPTNPTNRICQVCVALADDDAAELDACAAELDACAASIERQASELLTRVAQARDAARVLRSCSVTEKMVLPTNPTNSSCQVCVALADDDAAELDACAASIERQASELLTSVLEARDAARVLCSCREKMILATNPTNRICQVCVTKPASSGWRLYRHAFESVFAFLRRGEVARALSACGGWLAAICSMRRLQLPIWPRESSAERRRSCVIHCTHHD